MDGSLHALWDLLGAAGTREEKSMMRVCILTFLTSAGARQTNAGKNTSDSRIRKARFVYSQLTFSTFSLCDSRDSSAAAASNAAERPRVGSPVLSRLANIIQEDDGLGAGRVTSMPNSVSPSAYVQFLPFWGAWSSPCQRARQRNALVSRVSCGLSPIGDTRSLLASQLTLRAKIQL